MANRTFWALPLAVFLLVTACLPVRPDGASNKKNTTSPECSPCAIADCWETEEAICQQCQEECPPSFYRVRLLRSGECSKNPNDFQILKQIESIPIKPKTPIQPESTNVQATATDPTTTTTPAPNIRLCANCSLVGCVRCREGVIKPACEICDPLGYFLNNSTYTCTVIDSGETLSAVAIAGIVIAVLCLLGIGALGVFVLVRRFHRSRDLSRANKKVKMLPVANERFGWSRGRESAEVEELGIAPERPEINSNQYTDMQQSYDILVKGDQVEQSSYAPLKLSQENLYLNATATQAGSIYSNSPPHAAARQESGELYEDVAVRPAEDDSDHIYGNNICSSAPFRTVIETSDEIYANNCDDNTEDFYQNT